MVHFRGIIGYLVTPFGPSDAPDLSVLSGLVDHLIEQGFAPLPSEAQGAYPSRNEWESVARTTIDSTAGRLPVVVGASAQPETPSTCAGVRKPSEPMPSWSFRSPTGS